MRKGKRIGVYIGLCLVGVWGAPMLEAYGHSDTPNEQDVAAVVQWLSVRHPEPDCREVIAHTKASLETLRHVTAHVQLPPWVPMRAGRCLVVQHPTLGAPDMVKWVSEVEYKGLATLVFQHLESLPVSVAVEVATLALKGPHKDMARPYIERSTRAELQGLVSVPAD